MTSRISPDDWEILSAYLDGQVSAKEQEKIKQKLTAEPELQRALEELQRTKMVLRSAPRRRVPHNFTLSPSMIPQRKPFFRLVPTLSFASVMAAILMVLTFAFNGLTSLAGVGSLAAQPPALTQAAERANLAAPQTAPAQPGATSAPVIVWGLTGLGGGGGGGGDGGAGGSEPVGGGAADTTAVAPPGTGAEINITPTPDVGGGFGGGPTTVPGKGGNEPLPPEGTPTPGTTSEPSIVALPTETTVPPAPTEPPAAQPAPVEGTGPILGIRPTQEMGKIVVDQGSDQFTAPPTRTTAPAATPSFVSQHLVAIQVGLGVLALLMAVAAFLIHRKS